MAHTENLAEIIKAGTVEIIVFHGDADEDFKQLLRTVEAGGPRWFAKHYSLAPNHVDALVKAFHALFRDGDKNIGIGMMNNFEVYISGEVADAFRAFVYEAEASTDDSFDLLVEAAGELN